MVPGFFAVLVAEVNFDAGNIFREVAQGACHRGFGLLDHRFATWDVVIWIDLDFHDFIPSGVPGHLGGWGLYGPGEGSGGPGRRPRAFGCLALGLGLAGINF